MSVLSRSEYADVQSRKKHLINGMIFKVAPIMDLPKASFRFYKAEAYKV
jgi:hypothetical protein